MKTELDYEDLCDRTRAYILSIAREGGQTPTGALIAEACDYTQRAVTQVLKRLESEGRLQIVRRENSSIQIFRVADGDAIRSTTHRTPHPAMRVCEYGGGRIAGMSDRDKAEELILAVFTGELTEAEAQRRAQ